MTSFVRHTLPNLAASLVLAASVSGLSVTITAATAAPAPAPAPIASFGPPLSVVVATEHRYTDGEGVGHVDTWRDRLIRRPDRVWQQRLGVEAATAPTANTDAHGHGADHAMPNPARAATELTLVDGRAALHYADSRYYTAIPPEEWASTGFTADPLALAANVGPGLLARLPVSGRASPRPGARWHEGTVSGVAWRVLYDPAARFAWRIEARGRGGETTTVVATPAPMATPWGGYARLVARDYADLLD